MFTSIQSNYGTWTQAGFWWHETNIAIWRAFKKAAITIPYPQRDIHIKDDCVAFQGTTDE